MLNSILKKWYRLIVLVVMVLGVGSVMEGKSRKCCAPRHALILDSKGLPQKNLANLLEKFSIVHNGTLSDIVDQTQKKWLRKPGQERWDLSSDKGSVDVKSELVDCGCVDQVSPILKKYDYVLMMGALSSRMRTRLAYLIKLWEEGVRFKKLIFLGGERPRITKRETEADILGKGLENNSLPVKKGWSFKGDLPKTETGIMKVLFDQAELPKGFVKEVEVVFVDAPMKKNAQGKMTRPTTGDTINKWMEQNPSLGSCLVISNNPYIGYQDSVVRTLLPSGFTVETVGNGDDGSTSIAVHLDNLARWLYQEKQRRSKKS